MDKIQSLIRPEDTYFFDLLDFDNIDFANTTILKDGTISLALDVGKIPRPEFETSDEVFQELDEDDEYLLAKIAMAEAEGQSTKGKALVMCVVINRVLSNEFPDSVYDVIYEENQFSPISNGRFDRVEPNKDCYKSLNMIKSGWDESNGALYFESCKGKSWHSENLKFLFKVDEHRFYK